MGMAIIADSVLKRLRKGKEKRKKKDPRKKETYSTIINDGLDALKEGF